MRFYSLENPVQEVFSTYPSAQPTQPVHRGTVPIQQAVFMSVPEHTPITQVGLMGNGDASNLVTTMNNISVADDSAPFPQTQFGIIDNGDDGVRSLANAPQGVPDLPNQLKNAFFAANPTGNDQGVRELNLMPVQNCDEHPGCGYPPSKSY